jgi:hypothetical protein
MKKLPLVITIIFLLLVSSSYSEERIYKVKINLDTSENIMSLAQNHIQREIGKMKDVEIVDEGEEYLLQILIMETHTTAGKAYGYIASVVELSPFSKNFDTQLKMAGLDPGSEKVSWMRDNMSRLYQYRRHYFFTVPLNDLQSLCSRVVSDFDKESLEPSRKAWRDSEKVKEDDIKETERDIKKPIRFVK